MVEKISVAGIRNVFLSLHGPCTIWDILYLFFGAPPPPPFLPPVNVYFCDFYWGEVRQILFTDGKGGCFGGGGGEQVRPLRFAAFNLFTIFTYQESEENPGCSLRGFRFSYWYLPPPPPQKKKRIEFVEWRSYIWMVPWVNLHQLHSQFWCLKFIKVVKEVNKHKTSF